MVRRRSSPIPLSASMAESWRSGAAKALERKYAAVLEATARQGIK